MNLGANDRQIPNTIHPRNTLGYNFGIEYDHSTRFGLTLGIGILYGMRTHDIELSRNFSGFDSDAVNNLKSVTFGKRLHITTFYLGPSLLVGYKKQLIKKWFISLKAGICLRYYFPRVAPSLKRDMRFYILSAHWNKKLHEYKYI